MLSTSLVGLAEVLPEGVYRTVGRLLAPVLGYTLVTLARRAYREIQHQRFERLMERKVAAWKAELRLDETALARAIELRALIARYENLLLKQQLDNLDVKEQ